MVLTIEKSLYYLIYFWSFQIIISLQAIFQAVIEIKNGKIAKDKRKILSVVNAVDEITDIEERDEDSIIFSFQEKSYEVVIKHMIIVIKSPFE